MWSKDNIGTDLLEHWKIFTFHLNRVYIEICFLYFLLMYFPQYVCGTQYDFFFCGSLISCFPGMLLSYCLNYFEVFLVVPVITDISFALKFLL